MLDIQTKKSKKTFREINLLEFGFFSSKFFPSKVQLFYFLLFYCILIKKLRFSIYKKHVSEIISYRSLQLYIYKDRFSVQNN
jgi:hypothetical protein